MQDAAQLCLGGDVMRFLDDLGVEQVCRYFDPAEPFSGAAFDTFGGGGDAIGRRHIFTSEDLVAVTLLGVEVPGHAALAIVDGQASELSALLTKIPANVDLREAPVEVVNDSSAAACLWKHLEALPGIGWVTAHKLMARKRPRLLPVYDSVVKEALQGNNGSFWLPLRQELQSRALVERLDKMRMEAGLGDHVSLLRVLDVAVWMRNRRASNCRLDFAVCPNRPERL